MSYRQRGYTGEAYKHSEQRLTERGGKDFQCLLSLKFLKYIQSKNQNYHIGNLTEF